MWSWNAVTVAVSLPIIAPVLFYDPQECFFRYIGCLALYVYFVRSLRWGQSQKLGKGSSSS